jgi:hypothetical protein
MPCPRMYSKVQYAYLSLIHAEQCAASPAMHSQTIHSLSKAVCPQGQCVRTSVWWIITADWNKDGDMH